MIRPWLHFEHAPCYSKAQAFHALTDGHFKYIWRPTDGTLDACVALSYQKMLTVPESAILLGWVRMSKWLVAQSTQSGYGNARFGPSLAFESGYTDVKVQFYQMT